MDCDTDRGCVSINDDNKMTENTLNDTNTDNGRVISNNFSENFNNSNIGNDNINKNDINNKRSQQLQNHESEKIKIKREKETLFEKRKKKNIKQCDTCLLDNHSSCSSHLSSSSSILKSSNLISSHFKETDNHSKSGSSLKEENVKTKEIKNEKTEEDCHIVNNNLSRSVKKLENHKFKFNQPKKIPSHLSLLSIIDQTNSPQLNQNHINKPDLATEKDSLQKTTNFDVVVQGDSVAETEVTTTQVLKKTHLC